MRAAIGCGRRRRHVRHIAIRRGIRRIGRARGPRLRRALRRRWQRRGRHIDRPAVPMRRSGALIQHKRPLRRDRRHDKRHSKGPMQRRRRRRRQPRFRLRAHGHQKQRTVARLRRVQRRSDERRPGRCIGAPGDRGAVVRGSDAEALRCPDQDHAGSRRDRARRCRQRCRDAMLGRRPGRFGIVRPFCSASPAVSTGITVRHCGASLERDHGVVRRALRWLRWPAIAAGVVSATVAAATAGAGCAAAAAAASAGCSAAGSGADIGAVGVVVVHELEGIHVRRRQGAGRQWPAARHARVRRTARGARPFGAAGRASERDRGRALHRFSRHLCAPIVRRTLVLRLRVLARSSVRAAGGPCRSRRCAARVRAHRRCAVAAA